MQDNDEKLSTRHPIKPAVMGFPADKVTCRMQTFECDPFDLLGNAPYSNPPKSSPEKERKVGENSKYLIVENSGFLTMSRLKINGNFQNACLISSAPSYDLLGSAPCSGFLPDTKLV